MADSSPAGWLQRLAGEICRWELLILALCAPAFIFITPALSPVLLVLPALWLCRRASTGHFVPPGRLNVPLLFLMSALLINLFVTPDIRHSLPKVSNLLFGIALYTALVQWASTRRRRQWLLYGTLAISALLVLVALFATNWPHEQKFSGEPYALTGVLDLPRWLSLPGAERGINPNEVAGTLIIFVPFSAMMVLHEGRRPERSPVWIGLFLVLFTGLFMITFLTQSRSAMLGVFIGLLSLFAWKRWYGLALLGAPILILAILAITGQLGPLLLESGLMRKAAEISTLNGRLPVWQRAWYFFAQAPVTGIGLNQFRVAVPAFWPLTSPLLHGDIGHAHNHFMHVAVEMGIPGLIAYIGIWVVAFRQTLIGPGSESDFDLALIGCAGGLVAFLGYGIFDTVALGARAGFPFWIFLALVFALTKPIEPASNAATESVTA